jgi:uncharacterized membrane protein YhaH (DUF805 family)
MNLDIFIGSLKKYAVFTGRASRSEFVNFLLWSLILSIVLTIVEFALFPQYLIVTDQSLLGNIFTLAILLPDISVSIRRMHDVGKSGWYSLIPIYNLVLFFTKGDENENQYGANPNTPIAR